MARKVSLGVAVAVKVQCVCGPWVIFPLGPLSWSLECGFETFCLLWSWGGGVITSLLFYGHILSQVSLFDIRIFQVHTDGSDSRASLVERNNEPIMGNDIALLFV
jgi:hypothetical protein